MEKLDLKRKALLVSLHIGRWYNRRVDRLGTSTVQTSLNVETTGDVYIKRLIPQGYMLDIEKICSSIRTRHYQLTLPWLDNGMRILPSASFFEYCSTMDALKQQLSAAVTALCDQFPQLVEEARAKRGAMFHEADYPSVSDLRSMFRIDTPVFPFPDASDFRVELDETTLKDLSSRMQDSYVAMAEKAVEELRASVSDSLTKVLRAFKNEQVRSNTLDRLIVVAEMANKLNVTDDVRLKELATLANSILEYHVDMYKESDAIRKDAIAKLEMGL